ncbi:hypothetical protein GOBAR_AA06549 [Gossypium barbadense]|uniref:Uncharacterized protein n=1 Tax=Gossypium barbadense TaxID=3634 RepID=A0A2P5YEK4_GOSBA|nr:hypothetical protein GOBAR_AA06549 [Gossypium barbadense]
MPSITELRGVGLVVTIVSTSLSEQPIHVPIVDKDVRLECAIDRVRDNGNVRIGSGDVAVRVENYRQAISAINGGEE